MGKGTQIKMARSGDVIPAIKDVTVDESVEPIFPSDERGEWHWERLDIVLNNIEGNREVQIKRMTHFFTVLQVPRLREKTLEKLWEAGYHYPEDVVRASESELLKLKGFGKKTVTDMKTNINKALSEVPPDRFLVASTTLKSGIGRKLVKTLFRYIPTILSMSKEEIASTLKKKKIKGFGPKRIENISQNFPKFKEYLFSFAKTQVEKSIQRYQDKLEYLETKGRNPLIEGKTFVLTAFFGKTDYDLEDYIYDHFGEFSTTVTSSTEAVIAGNISDFTGKMEKAWELNVPVYSAEEFKEKYVI
jgi:NAD-dependent DNA ligase